MGHAAILDRTGFDQLLGELNRRGYLTVGPTVRDGAIVYDPVSAGSDLPVGIKDAQDAGTYRLDDRSDEALFGHVPGADSWKKYLHPQNVALWKGSRTEDSFVTVPGDPAPKYAFIGARPCEIAAIEIQDEVFLKSGHRDEVYRERRSAAFVVAVNCTTPGGTCFCVSMGTGPHVRGGYDIALTEVLGDDHRFVADALSDIGREVLETVESRPATNDDLAKAGRLVDDAATRMGRAMETAGLPGVLAANQQNNYWTKVAERCLACTNCTMVCPTCFCSNVEEQPSLDATQVERVRVWDSCFSLDFSLVHSGPVRSTTASRYRQWITHKLSSWHDQFGMSGCVGCGRCITWCPVGIDITQEARAIRANDMREAHVELPERR